MPPSFPISLNPAIHDKPAWREEYGSNWQQRTVDSDGLLQLIRAGTGWIAAAMSSTHRTTSAFKYADLAVVDIDYGMDLEDFLAHELAASALLYYTTASHQPQPGANRFRVVFRLPCRIDDPELYKAVVTQLISTLGSDKSCSDPCRIFYSYSGGTQKLLHPEATLPEAIINAAREQLQEDLKRRRQAADEADPISIAQAEWVLQNVINPTADGERHLFIRITAAAASVGDALYGAWSDWASRGHHGQGKNRRQTSERFFRGFSGNTTLATLFFLAGEQDPSWRKHLPDHLRSEYSDAGIPGVAGYSHQDFLGLHEIDPDDPVLGASTPSLLEWGASYSSSPAPADSDLPMPEPPPFDDAGIESQLDDDFETISYGDVSPDPVTPPPKRGRGRPAGSKDKSAGGAADEILDRIRIFYPGLRLNVLTQTIEYDGKDGITEVPDPSTVYTRISRGRKGDLYPKGGVHDILQVEAWERRYNPVTDYLESCAATAPAPYWDTIAEELLGVSYDEILNPRLPDGRLLANVILQRFLIGAIARATEPGCEHSWMMILIGDQNKGKSFFFQYLTPPDHLNRYPMCATVQQGIGYLKDRPHVLHAGWVVLLDECDRFFERRYVEELKNLVSVATDRSAPKYQNERSYPRSFVLAGNTNHDSFMLDPTGNRRFLPIRVTGKVLAPRSEKNLIIDLDKVKTDRDAIWSAARKAYLDGEPHGFSSDEISQVEEYMTNFMVDDPLMDAVSRVLQLHPSTIHVGRPAYLMADICKHLSIEEKDFYRVRQPIGDVLKRLGLRKVRIRPPGKRNPQNYWMEGDPDNPDTEAEPSEKSDIPLDW
jgi:predicted P-loop ATPase